MKYDKVVGNINIHIDTKRIDNNIRNAQKLLNEQIVADCDEYVPTTEVGALRNSVNYPDGIYGGIISYNTPYAHYQYIGEVYGPNIPIFDDGGNLTGFWSPPHKFGTGRPIHYHTQGTTSQWFERAKQEHGQQWVDLVKREVGKQ